MTSFQHNLTEWNKKRSSWWLADHASYYNLN